MNTIWTLFIQEEGNLLPEIPGNPLSARLIRLDEIKRALLEAGLEFVAVYDAIYEK